MQKYSGTTFPAEYELEAIVENSEAAINFIKEYSQGETTDNTTEEVITEQNTETRSITPEPQPKTFDPVYEESETKSVLETESQVSVQQPVDLSSVVQQPAASVVSAYTAASDSNTMVSQYAERFRPVAASPTEEYELDAELFRIRRSLAKIEKAQREFMVYARRDLNDKQLHRLERITLYIQRLRHSIQPDL